MSVTELLKQFQSLPAKDRKKFLRAALAAAKGPAQPKRAARRIEWPDVEARALRNTGGRLIPNPVLTERDETRF